ncbi:hypothetical protein C8J57DRAFT_376868 [Mycena rebaudengoi]|nr:hypothetical protein C8J57DRAFT_376868 [Mycena rebaudengoi]
MKKAGERGRKWTRGQGCGDWDAMEGRRYEVADTGDDTSRLGQARRKRSRKGRGGKWMEEATKGVTSEERRGAGQTKSKEEGRGGEGWICEVTDAGDDSRRLGQEGGKGGENGREEARGWEKRRCEVADAGNGARHLEGRKERGGRAREEEMRGEQADEKEGAGGRRGETPSTPKAATSKPKPMTRGCGEVGSK